MPAPAELFDPAAHEPLDATSWSEARALFTVDAIVASALDSYRAEQLWPIHPRDVESEDLARPCGYTSMYLGAAGVAWALERLGAASPIGANELVAAFEEAPDEKMTHGLLVGDVGVVVAAHRLDPLGGWDDRLERSVRDAISRPEQELMWGTAGSVLAALTVFRETHDQRWRVVAKEAIEDLWSSWKLDDELSCRIWTQDLYGSIRRFLGPIHGYAGNAMALLAAPDLLGEERLEELRHECAALTTRTARASDELVNWAPLVEVPAGAALDRVQLCHGAPGMIIGLDRVPAGFDPHLDELFLAGGELTWRAGPLCKGSNICHGTAGNGFAFLKLFSRTGDELWLERARAFATHAIGQRERDLERFGQGHHSLWTGDLGLAFYLRACVNGLSELELLERL